MAQTKKYAFENFFDKCKKNSVGVFMPFSVDFQEPTHSVTTFTQFLITLNNFLSICILILFFSIV